MAKRSPTKSATSQKANRAAKAPRTKAFQSGALQNRGLKKASRKDGLRTGKAMPLSKLKKHAALPKKSGPPGPKATPHRAKPQNTPPSRKAKEAKKTFLANATSPAPTAKPKNPRCGVAALLGLPNAGKSTLLNALLDHHVSITSPKSGTTRFPLRGIGLSGDSQIILIDTPGLFAKAQSKLERAMLHAAQNAPFEADVWLLVVDVTKGQNQLDQILKHFPDKNRPPLWIVLNKIDKIPKPELLAWASLYQHQADKIFMISALEKDGTTDLWKDLGQAMKPGPWLFDEDLITTLPQRLMAAEITREALLGCLNKEVPHHLYVETEAFETFENGSLKINQIIHVAEASHKPIILGARGQMIKKVGSKARLAMGERFDQKVHLFLYVRHTAKWQDQKDFYHMTGLETTNLSPPQAP